MRTTLFLGAVEYEKQTVLLSLTNLNFLQTVAYRETKTISEVLNNLISKSLTENVLTKGA